MNVKQVDPIHTPEFFYLGRDTGEVDADLNPILAYDLDYTEETVATGRKGRKKCKGGECSTHVDEDTITIYKDDVAVASYQLFIDYFTTVWNPLLIPLSTFDMVDGVISAEPSHAQLSGSLTVDVRSGLWNMSLVTPGWTVRVRWVITWIDETDMKFDYSDYTGTVESDRVADVETVTFEPAGIADGIMI